MKKIFLIALAFAAVVSAQARPITGKVTSGKTKLAGVIITDGRNFTTTDAKGAYTLDIADDARFVSVVAPSGYSADFSSGLPKFYVAVTPSLKKADFKLVKVAAGADYNLMSISDTQCKTVENFDEFKTQIMPFLVKEAAACKAQAVTAAVLLGDEGWDSWPAGIPQMYPAELKKLGVPVYAVMGNHDFNRDKKGLESQLDYESVFGPANWAFYLGDALVIGLKDIDYDTNKKYKEAYTQTEIDFVKGLTALVPADTKLYIAQHAPVYRWFKKNQLIGLADKLIAALEGRNVSFLSGHTHMANVIRVNDTMVDYNPAAISASIYYFDKWNNDGTPRGYHLFTSRDGKVDYRLRTVDFPEDFRMEFFNLGQSMYHPNSIVVNAWDASDAWKFEWYQDGQYMGAMEQVLDVSPSAVKEWKSIYGNSKEKLSNAKKLRPNLHYWAATPSQYAKRVVVVVTDANGEQTKKVFDMSGYCDVQGHRGGAGRKPEDTINSMQYALEHGCNTLELDVWLSGDKLPVVSHDSWFHTRLATRPDGTTVGPKDAKEYLYTMPYDSIKKYDVGLKLSEKFPEHSSEPAVKPLLSDLVDYCEKYAADHGLDLPRYNIEIKCKHSKDEGVLWSEVTENINTTLPLLLSKHLGDRLVIQCFDVFGLNYMHEHYPEVRLSYLTDEKQPDYAANMAKLNFKPDWISPHYSCVTAEMVKTCHAEGMKIVPWTPDAPEDIKRMIDLGCDAVITNYPDRMLELTRGYEFFPIGNENHRNTIK